MTSASVWFCSNLLSVRPLFCGESEVDQLGKILEWVLVVRITFITFIAKRCTGSIQIQKRGFSLKMSCCFRVIGLPPEEEWPTDVSLSRKNFPPLLPGPITDFVPEINEKGVQLLLVSVCHEPWKHHHTCLFIFKWDAALKPGQEQNFTYCKKNFNCALSNVPLTWGVTDHKAYSWILLHFYEPRINFRSAEK